LNDTCKSVAALHQMRIGLSVKVFFCSGFFISHKYIREIEKPTLGGVFFVWYYKAYFTKIVLETKNSISTLFQHEDKTYYWVHAVKEPEKKKKMK